MFTLIAYFFRVAWRNGGVFLEIMLYHSLVLLFVLMGIAKLWPAQEALGAVVFLAICTLMLLQLVPQQLHYHHVQHFWQQWKLGGQPMWKAVCALYVVVVGLACVAASILLLLYGLWYKAALWPTASLLMVLFPVSAVIWLVGSLLSRAMPSLLGLLVLPLVLPILLINLQLFFLGKIHTLILADLVFSAVFLPLSLLSSALCLKRNI